MHPARVLGQQVGMAKAAGLDRPLANVTMRIMELLGMGGSMGIKRLPKPPFLRPGALAAGAAPEAAVLHGTQTAAHELRDKAQAALREKVLNTHGTRLAGLGAAGIGAGLGTAYALGPGNE